MIFQYGEIGDPFYKSYFIKKEQVFSYFDGFRKVYTLIVKVPFKDVAPKVNIKVPDGKGKLKYQIITEVSLVCDENSEKKLNPDFDYVLLSFSEGLVGGLGEKSLLHPDLTGLINLRTQNKVGKYMFSNKPLEEAGFSDYENEWVNVFNIYLGGVL